MKKRLSFGLVALLVLALLGGCQGEGAVQKEEQLVGTPLYLEVFDLTFTVPEKWLENASNTMGYPQDFPEIGGQGAVYDFLPFEALELFADIATDETLSEEERMAIFNTDVLGDLRPLMAIIEFKEEPDLQVVEDYLGYNKIERVEEERFLYYLTQELDTEGLGEESRLLYEELYEDLDAIRGTIKTGNHAEEVMEESKEAGKSSQHAKLEDLKQWTFEGVGIDGEVVDSSMFSAYPLTLVNVWGTFCGPCKAEIPDLVELAKEYEGRVGFLGVVSDVYEGSEENLDAAKEIVSTMDVPYPNVLLNQSIQEDVTRHIMGIPTTFFVDENGNVVGQLIVGARSKDVFQSVIDDLLGE